MPITARRSSRYLCIIPELDMCCLTEGDSCGYGFSSGKDAAETALNIWELFLGGYPTKSTTTRPFGNAVLDGIDLDVECAANGTDPMYYTTFVQQLRSLMQNGSSSSAATESLGTASYLITAAPQCVFPDAFLGPQLTGLALTNAAMQFDYLWPQFYNNHICQYNEADKGAGFQQSFQNWSSWASVAAPSMEVLVGLPASASAANTGYMGTSDEEDQIKLIRKRNATNFDGVMLWSAAWEFANEEKNQSYLPTVLQSLTGKLMSGPLYQPSLAMSQALQRMSARLCWVPAMQYSVSCSSLPCVLVTASIRHHPWHPNLSSCSAHYD